MRKFCIKLSSGALIENSNTICKMFYVVRLIDFSVNIVIPQNWIQDNRKILERYMYYGIKKTQTHLCYYSQKNCAIIMADDIMIPNGNFEPNFRAPMSSIFPCDEGTFRCQVIAFKG